MCLSISLLLIIKTEILSFSKKICFLAVCAVFLMASPINTERYLTIFSIENDYNIQSESGRLGIWKIGWRVFLENPFTGVGVGCFSTAVGLDRQFRDAGSRGWQTAHNSVVQIGTETGFFGLLLFFLLSVNVFRIFWKVRKKALNHNLKKMAEMGFIGFVGLFSSGLFLSQAYSIYFTFYFALSAIVNQMLIREGNMCKKVSKSAGRISNC